MYRGKKITIRRAEISDLEFLFELENNPKNSEFTTIENACTREQISSFIQDFTPIQFSGQLRFIIVENNENLPVGTIDFFNADFINQNANVGIIIDNERFRGKGLGSEALELVIHYAKNRLDLINLGCTIKENNLISMRLFEKAGFIKVGIRKEWYFHEVKRIDEHIYQLCLKEIK